MKKILVCILLVSGIPLFAQAPYGNFLPLAPGQYCVNADTCVPAGANRFSAAAAWDTITVEFYYKLNEAASNVSSLLNIGPLLFINDLDGYHQYFEYSGGNVNQVTNLYPDQSAVYEWN